MIKITEYVEVTGFTIMSFFACPFCGSSVHYRNSKMAQYFCYSCRTVLVDAQNLVDNQAARIMYHLNGEDAVLCSLLNVG